MKCCSEIIRYNTEKKFVRYPCQIIHWVNNFIRLLVKYGRHLNLND